MGCKTHLATPDLDTGAVYHIQFSHGGTNESHDVRRGGGITWTGCWAETSGGASAVAFDAYPGTTSLDQGSAASKELTQGRNVVFHDSDPIHRSCQVFHFSGIHGTDSLQQVLNHLRNDKQRAEQRTSVTLGLKMLTVNVNSLNVPLYCQTTQTTEFSSSMTRWVSWELHSSLSISMFVLNAPSTPVRNQTLLIQHYEGWSARMLSHVASMINQVTLQSSMMKNRVTGFTQQLIWSPRIDVIKEPLINHYSLLTKLIKSFAEYQPLPTAIPWDTARAGSGPQPGPSHSWFESGEDKFRRPSSTGIVLLRPLFWGHKEWIPRPTGGWVMTSIVGL